MINAGILIIDKNGKDNVSLLFPIFENYLNKTVSSSYYFGDSPAGYSFYCYPFRSSLSLKTCIRGVICDAWLINSPPMS